MAARSQGGGAAGSEEGGDGVTEILKDDTVKALPPEPTPYTFRGTMLGEYRGQPCRIVGQFNPLNGSVHVQFLDGLTALVPRYTLRRKRGSP
jgi:hypothetical protein